VNWRKAFGVRPYVQDKGIGSQPVKELRLPIQSPNAGWVGGRQPAKGRGAPEKRTARRVSTHDGVPK